MGDILWSHKLKILFSVLIRNFWKTIIIKDIWNKRICASMRQNAYVRLWGKWVHPITLSIHHALWNFERFRLIKIPTFLYENIRTRRQKYNKFNVQKSFFFLYALFKVKLIPTYDIKIQPYHGEPLIKLTITIYTQKPHSRAHISLLKNLNLKTLM